MLNRAAVFLERMGSINPDARDQFVERFSVTLNTVKERYQR